MQVRIKRVYEPRTSSDGMRVLVDRLWPRGVRKEAAGVDVWAKDLAPSSELRRWFAHENEKFEEFTRRYRLELESAADDIDKLLSSVGSGVVTLLYASRNNKCNHAIALQAWLESRWTARGGSRVNFRKPG